MLASIEQAHGTVLRIADDSDLGEQILAKCVSGSRAYQCKTCDAVFAIEPDGECALWRRVD